MPSCSICSAAPEVLKAINESLAAHEKLRDLAARSKFSRSALSRHSRRCVRRAVIQEHASKIFVPGRDRIRVYFAGQTLTDLSEHDVLVEICYEKFVTYAEKNPPEPATAAATESQPSVAIEPETIAPAPPQLPKPATVETVETPCNHEMKLVAGDVSRCVRCGFQTQPAQIIGVGKAFVEQSRDPMSRFDGLFRKFGR